METDNATDRLLSEDMPAATQYHANPQLKNQTTNTSADTVIIRSQQRKTTTKSHPVDSKHPQTKSILKQTHKFVMSSEKTLNEDDLERRATSDVGGRMRIKFEETPPKTQSKVIRSTGAALMSDNALQSEVIRLQTDNEILNITLKHLQEEMNLKSEVVRRQNQELLQLRQTVLDLQSEN